MFAKATALWKLSVGTIISVIVGFVAWQAPKIISSESASAVTLGDSIEQMQENGAFTSVPPHARTLKSTKTLLNTAVDRTFGDNFIPPLKFICEGIATGQVSILHPDGSFVRWNFNNEPVYQTRGKFQVCESATAPCETKSVEIYFRLVCMNAIRPYIEEIQKAETIESEVVFTPYKDCSRRASGLGQKIVLSKRAPRVGNSPPAYSSNVDWLLNTASTKLRKKRNDEFDWKSYNQNQATRETAARIESDNEFAAITNNKKFVVREIDPNNVDDVKTAANTASRRAFPSCWKPPVRYIVEGTAIGKMKVLEPSGRSSVIRFTGKEIVFRGVADFECQIGERYINFTTFVYYFAKCFNPIRAASEVNSKRVMFIEKRTNSVDEIPGTPGPYKKVLEHSWIHLTDNCVNCEVEREPPCKNCRAHFTGDVICPIHTIPYRKDNYSEFVGAGEYPDNKIAFPKAYQHTFDGIAVDAQTRVVIYSGKRFTGSVLVDVVGPAIVNNKKWMNNAGYSKCIQEPYKEDEIQKTFPLTVRRWSVSNMHVWSEGSLKVYCQ